MYSEGLFFLHESFICSFFDMICFAKAWVLLSLFAEVTLSHFSLYLFFFSIFVANFTLAKFVYFLKTAAALVLPLAFTVYSNSFLNLMPILFCAVLNFSNNSICLECPNMLRVSFLRPFGPLWIV